MVKDTEDTKVKADVLSAEELQLAKDAMELEQGGDDADLQDFSTSPTRITITDNQHQQIISFLEHYGINTEGYTLEEAYAKYQRIMGLAEEQAQVLSRGAVLDTFDRLLKYVPKGFKGEFFHESRTELDRAAAMGWVPLKSEVANLDSSTGKSDGLVRVGDLVLHIIPDEDYAAKQIARERRHANNRAKRKKEQAQPSQGALGVDPLGQGLGAHPKHPLRPLSELQKVGG